MSFLYIFWNSSGVRHDRPLGGGLTINSDAYYYKLIHAADKCHYHNDKTAKSYGPSLLHGNARAYFGF